jgi:hypothetical protein
VQSVDGGDTGRARDVNNASSISQSLAVITLEYRYVYADAACQQLHSVLRAFSDQGAR